MTLDVYEKLRKHFDTFPTGFPKTEKGLEINILKKYFSEEEAEIACTLALLMAENAPPKNAQTLAAEMNKDIDDIEKMLASMFKKGLIYKTIDQGSTLFSTLPFLPGIFDFNPDLVDFELANDFEKYFDIAYGPERAKGKIPLTKTVPVSRSIPSEPTIHPTEDVIRTIEESSSICVMECMCRTRKNLIGKGCGRPVETCMFLNQFAEHLNEIGKGRKVSKEEAIKILNEAEDAGLIHVSNNSHGQLFGICSCCGCCCIELQTLIKLEAPAAVAKSDFKLIIDIDLCSGCEDCLDRCWFEALSIADQHVEVDYKRCMGCGACVKVCPTECLTLERKPPEEIEPTPSDYVEMLSEMGWR